MAGQIEKKTQLFWPQAMAVVVVTEVENFHSVLCSLSKKLSCKN